MSRKNILSYFSRAADKPSVKTPAETSAKTAKRIGDSEGSDEDNISVSRKGKRRRLVVDSDEDSRSPKKENRDRNNVETKTEISSVKTVKKENGVETKPEVSDSKKSADVGFAQWFKKTDATEEKDYDPAKPTSSYRPIEDASWCAGEKVPYFALARTLEEIEKISSRLKIVDILSNFFRSVIVSSPEDLLPCIYLCLNKLGPAHKSLELGVADATLMKAIAQSTGRSISQIKTDCNSFGDIGIVAERSRCDQRIMRRPAPLTVRKVYEKFTEIAKMTGHSTMSTKLDRIQAMFVACRGCESKYLIRSLAGKLRIGLAEQSVLQALAQACSLTPPRKGSEEQILNASKNLSSERFKSIVDEQALTLKTAYCECPDYDLIIPVILNNGIMELPLHCKLTPGIPFKPMLAHPTKGISEVLHRFENLSFTCEWKYDGERAQIHVPSKDEDHLDTGAATIYSRNQENNTSKYPDILSRLPKVVGSDVKSCILDCEVVAWDREKEQILPFQILSTRKRKDAKDSDIKINVCVYMFDLLYLNGEPLVKKPFAERRALLKENFVETEGEWQFATSLDCNTTEDIQEFLEESIRGNCEGLMIKTLQGKDSSYEIARRSRNWLKLKKDYVEGIGDTIDAVVLGGYLGRGKRTGVYGGFLLGCYDKESEEYQSLCKIGTGFSDENLQSLSKSLGENIIKNPKNYYRYDSSLEPDHWFDVAQVWEIKCGDLSLSPIHRAAIGIVDADKGISLRFPRFIRVRDDKSPEDATSAHQIAELYLNQDQVKNQNKTSTAVDEDFY